MRDIIKEKYAHKAIIYSGIWMYFISTSKEIVRDCKENNIKIASLEAFKITGKGIQPSQKHSIDLKINEDNWDKLADFLSNVTDTDYLYEIWYEGYE